MPNPRPCRGAGDPSCPGASSTVIRGRRTTFAPARQLTPQAEEGDQTLRPTTLFAALSCAAALAATASPALAADNGGTSTYSGGSSAQFDPGQLTGDAPDTPDTVAPQPPAESDPVPQTAHTAPLAHGAAVAPADTPAS